MKRLLAAAAWAGLALLPPALARTQAPGTPAAAPAQAPAPLLQWLVQDIPPHFSFRDGRVPQRAEDLGQGEVDGFMRLLIERLPQFRHEMQELSLPRFEALARQGGPALCSVLHVKTPERLQWLYFTHLHPPMASRQIHVIVRREDLPRFETGGQPLQLGDLLKRSDLVGLLPRNRSFGPRIDQLLQARADQAPKTVVAGRSMHLLPMLRARRMDYTLEYPVVVDEFMQQPGSGPELVKLPLAEGRSTTLATVGCSRTPEGRRAIEAIDQVVRQLAADPQRDAWIRHWRGHALDGEDQLRLQRYLDERARGGPQID